MKIVVAGNYGAGNLGDELILEGMIKTLRRIDPQVDLTVLSADPHATKGKFEIHSAYKFPAGIRSFLAGFTNERFMKTSRTVKECDFFVLGGGGLFDPSSKRGVVVWAIQGLLALWYKKPIIMYGQNLPKIDKGLTKKIVKYLFNKSVFIALRDKESIANLKEILGTAAGTTGAVNKIHKIPDLIFKSQPRHLEPKTESVVLALREAPSVTNEHLRKIAKFINFIQDQRKNLTVELVPFEKNTDEKLISFMLDLLAEKDRINIHEYTEDRVKIEKLFSSAKLVIGMRLHSVLMAINVGTPFIALGYNQKVKNILSSLNLSDFSMGMDEIDLEKIRKMFEMIIGDQEGMNAKILKERDAEIAKFEDTERDLTTVLTKAFYS